MIWNMQFKLAAKKLFSNLIIIEIWVIIIFLILGSYLFHIIENHTFFDSIYFMAMTMTTIGFGDITPHTDIGKILVIVYGFMGVPLFVSLSGLILESRFNKTIRKYIVKVHKEVQAAEEEIRHVEEKVTREIEEAIGDTQDKVENNKDQIEKIEQVMEEKKSWRKKILKK